MDLERYYELRAILQQWRMRLAESIRQRIEATRHWLNRLRAIYPPILNHLASGSERRPIVRVAAKAS